MLGTQRGHRLLPPQGQPSAGEEEEGDMRPLLSHTCCLNCLPSPGTCCTAAELKAAPAPEAAEAPAVVPGPSTEHGAWPGRQAFWLFGFRDQMEALDFPVTLPNEAL